MFYFFSDRSEWYWERRNPVVVGNFPQKSLSGFKLFRKIQIIPELLKIALCGKYDVYIKCINGRFALPIIFLGAKLRKKPFILWTELWMHPQTLFHQLTFPLVKFIYNKADAIVVGGTHCKKYLENIGIDSQKIFIGWNAVNNCLYSVHTSSAELAEIKSKIGLNNQKIILYVGRLEEVKGLNYLFRAVSELDREMPVALLVIGSGSCEKKLRELAANLLLDNVYFLDYIQNDILYKYYALAEVFILPSITTRRVKETWGFVINEAMNQGCPVIASDAVGAAMGGLVQDGVTGYIVPERDVNALTGAILKIINDTSLHSKMQKAALGKISKWDHDFQAQGFLDAIDFVLKK